LSAISWRPPLGELFDGFFALLDQGGEHGWDSFVVERGHLLDLAKVQRALDHAQGGEALLIARLHGGGDVFLDLFDEAHDAAIIAE